MWQIYKTHIFRMLPFGCHLIIIVVVLLSYWHLPLQLIFYYSNKMCGWNYISNRYTILETSHSIKQYNGTLKLILKSSKKYHWKLKCLLFWIINRLKYKLYNSLKTQTCVSGSTLTFCIIHVIVQLFFVYVLSSDYDEVPILCKENKKKLPTICRISV